MKAFSIVIFLFFLSVNLSAQKLTPKAIEFDLLKSFKRITYWETEILNQRDKGDVDREIDYQDSLEISNNKFLQKLKKYILLYPGLINQRFYLLKHWGLSITTSDDKLLRIFSWDTGLGGTAHDVRNVVQYQVSGKAKLFEPEYNEEGGKYAYEKAYSFTNAHKKCYLVTYSSVLSTKDIRAGIQTFAIENGILNDNVKIIKTKTGMHSELSFEYDLFSGNDWNNYPEILFDEKVKTIKVPLVIEGGKALHRYITYKFTGQYFEKVK